MIKKKMSSIKEIQDALDQGIKVYWAAKNYLVHYVEFEENNPKFSLKDGKVIRVSHYENYFGSLIHPEEVYSCFIDLSEKVG
jgi:disulfide oxidoreductase YuzD